MVALLLEEDQAAVTREFEETRRTATGHLQNLRDLSEQTDPRSRELIRVIAEQAIAGAVDKFAETERLWSRFVAALRVGSGGERVRGSLRQALTLFDSCNQILTLADEFADLADGIGARSDRVGVERAREALTRMRETAQRMTALLTAPPPDIDPDRWEQGAEDIRHGRYRTADQLQPSPRPSEYTGGA